MSAPTSAPVRKHAGTTDLTGWVAEELGLTVELAGGTPAGLDALAGLALRRNPKRAHLLVSRVLGKHIPVDPRAALQAAADLAARAQAATEGAPALVIGFAETATALAQAVAAALPGATCALSTRRPAGPVPEAFVFAEEHSHAVAHRVLAPAGLLADPRPVVLVDDELSSGRTAVNTIRALHAAYPHPGYVVAALLDMRPAAAEADFAALAEEIGVPVRPVSLLRGQVHVPADAPARVAERVSAADPPLQPGARGAVSRIDADLDPSVAISARYGWTPSDEAALAAAVAGLADRLLATGALATLDTAGSDPGARGLLVLGTEELMYAPMLLAAALADRLPAHRVRYQSTTRSPVAPIDRDGYAIRCALTFPAPDPTPDEPGRASYVYNVRPGVADLILLVSDGGDTGGVLDVLSGCAPVTEVLLRDEVGGRPAAPEVRA